MGLINLTISQVDSPLLLAFFLQWSQFGVLAVLVALSVRYDYMVYFYFRLIGFVLERGYGSNQFDLSNLFWAIDCLDCQSRLYCFSFVHISMLLFLSIDVICSMVFMVGLPDGALAVTSISPVLLGQQQMVLIHGWFVGTRFQSGTICYGSLLVMGFCVGAITLIFFKFPSALIYLYNFELSTFCTNVRPF